MSTPPKAPCHSCNGTGIDPTVGFLDCEFCTPAPAGVSLSTPEQPEPKCATCNDHGEIGCLRPDGYDGERCPDCNPATVKRYYVGKYGLVEGEALGRLSVVLAADHDRVTAERNDLHKRLTAAEQRNSELSELLRDTEKSILWHQAQQPMSLRLSRHLDRARTRIKKAIKPTESGASE